MAFPDPQSVTINAVAQSLPRTSSGSNSGEFTKDDGNVKVTISHQYGTRNRRTVRLTHRKIAADPLVAAQNLEYSMTTYVVMDVPKVGYTVAEAKYVVDALSNYLLAGAGSANTTTRVLGGEI